MADGAFSPPRLHDDGVYLDLDMQAYVDDPAISGSGLKKLITSPPDFKWELPKRNPLFTPTESDAKSLGTLVHCAVLEAMSAFEHRYFVAPAIDDDDPRTMRTADQAKNWLKDRGQKVSGVKAELFDRVRAQAELMKLEGASDDELPIFLDEMLAELSAQGNGRREKIKPRDFQYVSLVATFVRAWPQANALLSHGLPEVSIFWRSGKVRYKARLDWLSATAIVDVKKFGQAPTRGLSLESYLQREAVKYCYDIQAVHNRGAAMQIPLLLGQPGAVVSASGENASARLDQLRTISDAILETPPDFHWLFLRTPGPPQGLIMPFTEDTKRWQHCEYEIRDAIEALESYRAKCGDELDADRLWLQTGFARWDDDALPPYMWEQY